MYFVSFWYSKTTLHRLTWWKWKMALPNIRMTSCYSGQWFVTQYITICKTVLTKSLLVCKVGWWKTLSNLTVVLTASCNFVNTCICLYFQQAQLSHFSVITAMTGEDSKCQNADHYVNAYGDDQSTVLRNCSAGSDNICFIKTFKSALGK